jgi:hypothetical protein
MKENEKFGNLFYHNGDVNLIQNILYDISEILGYSVENPLSINFVCLYLGMHKEISDRISSEIIRTFKSEKKNDLRDWKYVRRIMIKHFPDAKDFSELSILTYLRGLSKSVFPEILEIL